MSNLGKHDWISLYAVIGSVIQELGLGSINNHLDTFARWAYEAEMNIGSSLSFEHYECELQIKNYNACLPSNLHVINAVKNGAEYLNYSTKDFVFWNKSSKEDQNFKSSSESYNGWGKNISDPGQKQGGQITVNNTFSETDVVSIIVITNTNGTIERHTFNYSVTINDDQESIALELYNQMNNGAYDFTVTLAGNIIDIIADTTLVTYTVNPYTDSITGTVEYVQTQKFRAPRKKSDSAVDTKIDPMSTSTNLAEKTALNIDVGTSSQDDIYTDRDDHDNKYSIQNGRIYVNFMEEGKIGISYEGVKVDDHGLPLIRSSHEQAVKTYMKYMFKGIGWSQGKVPHHVYMKLEQDWQNKCADARGGDEMPSNDELRMLGNLMNNLLPMAGLQRS